MIENMVRPVECFCENRFVMTAACDPEDNKDTWKYSISIEAPDGFNFCCLMMNARGVNNVIEACDVYNHTTGQAITLLLKLPNELNEFMGLVE
jgi:hypothetical protein